MVIAFTNTGNRVSSTQRGRTRALLDTSFPTYLTRKVNLVQLQQHPSVLALACTLSLLYINTPSCFQFLFSLSLCTEYSGKKEKRKVQRAEDFNTYSRAHISTSFHVSDLNKHTSSSSSSSSIIVFLLSTAQLSALSSHTPKLHPPPRCLPSTSSHISPRSAPCCISYYTHFTSFSFSASCCMRTSYRAAIGMRE